MRLTRRKVVLLLITVLVFSLAMWMLKKEYHSKNLVQIRSLALHPSSTTPVHHHPPIPGELSTPSRLSSRLLPHKSTRALSRHKLPPLPPPSTSQLPLQSPLRPSNPKHCKYPHCKEVLSKTDRIRQKACLSEILKKHVDKISPQELALKISENDCNFIGGGKRAPVALVSAEGSGNTWVRGLLEKSSGYCTGFNFCDYIMRMKGFVGENINSGSVLVVKTHMKMPQWIGSENKQLNRYEAKYGSAIFLLRNPYYSLIAEWNRRLTNNVLKKQHKPHNESHVNVAPKEIWFSNSWDEFLHRYMTLWVERIQNWVLNRPSGHPVIVVRYEDLKQDTMMEVGRMLGFLNLHISSENLSQRLEKDFTTFKRPHCETCDFTHYTVNQKLCMKSSLQHAVHLAEGKNMTSVFKLNEYLKEFE